MRVAICHHFSLSYLGGGERMVISAARKLVARGDKVHVFSLPLKRRDNRLGRVLGSLGDVGYSEGWSHAFDADVSYFVFAPLVWRLFQPSGPTVAGLHGFFGAIGACAEELARLGLGPRLRLLGPKLTAASCYERVLERSELASFDVVHTVSRSLTPVHRRVMFVPNWVDRDVFRPSTEKSEVFTVLFVGRREWMKGYDLFEGARSMLQRGGFDFAFSYAMEDDGGVRGASFLEDSLSMAGAYSRCHVCVCPSRADTFGLSIVESLACGTPVVTTSLPTHRELRLPVFYADSLSAVAYQVQSLFRLWREDRAEYEELCQRGVVESGMYDSGRVFPKFVRMLSSAATEA